MTKTYEVNANGGRTYQSDKSADVASVAVTWAKQGHEPQAWAIVAGERIETRQVAITTVRKTARALAG